LHGHPKPLTRPYPVSQTPRPPSGRSSLRAYGPLLHHCSRRVPFPSGERGHLPSRAPLPPRRSDPRRARPWRTCSQARCFATRSSLVAPPFSQPCSPARAARLPAGRILPRPLRALSAVVLPFPLRATAGGASFPTRPTGRRALPHPPRSDCSCCRWGGRSALLLPGLLCVEARRED
jgi:hypothetical protein